MLLTLELRFNHNVPFIEDEFSCTLTLLWWRANSETSRELILDQCLRTMCIEKVINLEGWGGAALLTRCITTNSTNQASASCISMVTELPQRRWRQQWGCGGGGGVGKEREENRCLLLFHRGFKKSSSPPHQRPAWIGWTQTAEAGESRDGEEGCLGWETLWDQDMQCPLILSWVAVVWWLTSARWTSHFSL